MYFFNSKICIYKKLVASLQRNLKLKNLIVIFNILTIRYN